MPIVFVHGVATRNGDKKYEDHWKELSSYLRDYVAPEISSRPKDVAIVDAYWGDLAAKFAWNGASRPLSPLLGMGTAQAPSNYDQALALASLPGSVQDVPVPASLPRPTGGLVAAGSSAIMPNSANALRLKNLSSQQLSDLLAAVIQGLGGTAEQKIAADVVANDHDIFPKLAACLDSNAEVQLLIDSVQKVHQATSQPGLAGMGSNTWFQSLQSRLSETLHRVGSSPGFVLSRALGEMRKPINDAVTLFLGDVFAYLHTRRDASKPGEISLRVLNELKVANGKKLTADEPMVVVSHSMGGQVVYDLVTHFLPKLSNYSGIRIDFWCATASQVGLFEELKLFCESSPNYGKQQGNLVPFPDSAYLGGWWNVWDFNDFISYTARPIVAGVEDEAYNSGLSVVSAHSGYLARPSFYRQLAEKLKHAKAQNWRRP